MTSPNSTSPRARTQPRYLNHRVSGRTPTRLEFDRFPDEDEPQVDAPPVLGLIVVAVAAVALVATIWFGLVVAYSL